MHKLSVIMSVLNGEKFIEGTVRSVLAQTFADFRFIIVDDGSTDRTKELIRQFGDNRIQLIELPQNVGIPAARNIGLDAADGELIAVVDADDPPLPERFEKQIAFLESRPHVAVVGCQFRVMNDDGVFFTDSKAQNDSPVGSTANLTNILRGSISTMHPCAMYRGDLLRRFRYDERFRVGHDYDLGLRLYEAGWQTDNLDEYLNLHRDHPHSVTDAFRDVDFNDHHTAFAEFAERLTGTAFDGDELKAYAWSFHFRFLPPGLKAINAERTVSILKTLLDAYAKKHPDKIDNETYRLILADAAPREAIILRAYWKELLKNSSGRGGLYLYGAGQHSVWLAGLCRELDIPVELIFDDNPKQDALEGIPVRQTDRLVDIQTGTILISSDIHNRAMNEKLNRRFPNATFRIVDPYQQFPPGPFQKY